MGCMTGAGDHGDDPFKEKVYVRLSALNSNVLHSGAYIYYPKHLMKEKNVAGRLRRNSKQLTHTLDFYSTLKGILHGSYNHLTNENEGCIAGVDLTSVDIPEDRAVIAANTVVLNTDVGMLAETR